MSWITIVVAIVAYFLRHFDPAGIHTPESDTVKLLKAAEKAKKDQALQEMLSKLTGGSPPASPP